MSFLTPDPKHLDRTDRPRVPVDPALVPAARYRAWDGSQAVPDLTADEIVDQLADDLLEHGDLAEALRDLMDRGLETGDPSRGDMRGLRDLLDRIRDRRRELLKEGQLADPLADVRDRLDDIVEQERAGVQRRLDETEPGFEPDGQGSEGTPDEPAPTPSDPQLQRMLRGIAAKRLDSLNAMPPDVGARIRALQDYDFLDGDARQRFEDLLDELRRSMLDRMSQGLADAVRSMKPEDLEPQREMVKDLNQLLSRRAQGDEPGQGEVDEFLAKHGAFFPGARTLDDVIEQLADRMAAMQSLMRSLSPEQRAELQDTLDALLRDDRLRWDLAQLAANLDQLLPGGLGERVRFTGDQPLGLEAALDQLGRLQALDQLEAQLDGAGGPGDLAQIDRAEVRDLLGADAAQDLDGLEDLADRLERAGYLERDGDHLELTARGHRRIGQKVLDELFARLDRDAFGGHRLAQAGWGGERDETSKPFEFGDPFHLDLRSTLGNSLRRDENAPGRRAPGAPIRVRHDDFEVFRTERTTSASTVLLIDMSRSMLLRNCYLAAKKVAIALDTLIRTQYPRDHLAIVGFAYYARELRPEALAELSWHTYEYGTNLQHGLLLARRILARQRSANKEIVVITDGEPTAHFEDGQVEFSYPPTRRTIRETLREVVRCTKDGITINTFMLERSPALTDFVGYVTELNKGRAFYAEPERLGEYVLVDFVRRRTTRLS
ncbi:MAG TPA: VWA domain-containing protein [Candidatus Limnocylindrales bacterium]|nr:VWA domain-containing protein [Candidatus Limnocylindrales bacterium]